MADDKQKNDDNAQQDSEDDGSQQSPAPTWLSWSIRAASGLLVVALIGYFVYMAAQPVVEPTIEFTMQRDKVEQRGGSWAVPVEITNRGTISVHALAIRATRPRVGNNGDEEQTLVIPLIGPNEMVETTFWFSEDPRNRPPEFAVESYLAP
ncbi:hypothetical protein [Neolewinella antarctica]|uniref:Uncharacterized protein (TIGR02588 family) n=1 Tax=Neolewinella antarctica TaxID=442734 RepID=A0ABX0XC60_9BACT|nr:hypothetical protein [Neolewinella antarctica]NJC26797.1 uncharacterized protein (TIGR02588 family) [Neolewinella antarctica]